MLVVGVVGQRAVKAAGRLTEALAVDHDALVGGRDHFSAVPAAFHIVAAQFEAARGEHPHRLAEHRPILARAVESVRRLAEVVAAPHAARDHRRPAMEAARRQHERDVLLVVTSVSRRNAHVPAHRRLNRRELHASPDVCVKTVLRRARSVSHRQVLQKKVLRHRGRLPQTGGHVRRRYAVKSDSKRAGTRVAAIAAPALIDAVQLDRVLLRARVPVAGHIGARRVSNHLRTARHRPRRIELFAVEHANRLIG